LRKILEKLAAGTISVDEAEKALKIDVVEKVTSVARLDVARELRRGVPEIVFGEGKSVEDLVMISARMLEKNGRAILTRVDKTQLASLEARFGGTDNIRKFPHSKSVVIKRERYQLMETGGRVGILTAGTVDLAVAEDAGMVANEMGCSTYLEADAGVAGIHRLIEPLRDLIEKDVDSLIVVAGREGALPTVVAGLVDIPLIAVPASSGYGYGGGGRAALMAMLQACSLGLAVVNIDSGIAAGVVAAQIANRVAKARKSN